MLELLIWAVRVRPGRSCEHRAVELLGVRRRPVLDRERGVMRRMRCRPVPRELGVGDVFELHRWHVLGRGRGTLLELLSWPELVGRIGVLRELFGGVLPSFRGELLRKLRGGPVFGRRLVGLQRLHAGLLCVEHRDIELRAVRSGSVLGRRGLVIVV